jgi:hypothetical protein
MLDDVSLADDTGLRVEQVTPQLGASEVQTQTKAFHLTLPCFCIKQTSAEVEHDPLFPLEFLYQHGADGNLISR